MVPVLSIVPPSGSIALSPDGIVPALSTTGVLVEHEIACSQRCRVDTMQSDRLTRSDGDHRVAAGRLS